MSNLIKYESAKFALQQALEIDEVKDIRDKAQAMASYAKQANDTKLIEWATEIKVRAERKAGKMLAEMPKNPGKLNNSSWSHDATTAKTLSELGINKTKSSRWQKLAAIPDDQFEQAVSAAKEIAGEVTTAAMLRIEKSLRKSVVSESSTVTDTTAPKAVNNSSNKKPELKIAASQEDRGDDESQEAFNELYGDFDPIAELETANKEIERLTKIIESDDALALVVAENKKLTDLNSVLESQVNGYMNSLNEFKRSTKYWKTKFEKLEKQVNAAGLVDF